MTYTEITVEELINDYNAVIFGSAALGLEHKDIDLALSSTNTKFEDLKLKLRFSERLDISTYCQSSPESGFYGLYRLQTDSGKKIDLLILNNDEDLDVIRSTIVDLNKIPKYFLEYKPDRIWLYQKGLRHRGWEPSVQEFSLRPGRWRVVTPNEETIW